MNESTIVVTKPKAPKVSAKEDFDVKVSDENIRRLSDVFKLVADMSRLKILLALAQSEEMHVSALCHLLKQSQPAVSHHLTLMRMSRLVDFRRDGKHNYYYLKCGVVRDLLEQVFVDCGNGHRQIQFNDFSLSYKRK